MIAKNIDEVFQKLDFTDSIITAVKWEDNLIDLALYIDYYWDIQEGFKETRMLKVTFKSCLKVDFLMTQNLIEMSDSEVQTYILSWFTIVSFRKSNIENKNLNCIEIFTTNYTNPWLTVLCKEIQVDEINQ
ncbi:hypothetical protein [Ruminiclostridium papyrosolvens]|uniref:Uncharacterized protein n=1 Tax=Ruminiclostridium papyrosolvens C7 TaxID=1330534 RepID=U4R766_9FIRM|nr:hypothetical protein [Ruminiclostridium papyrosolvens]EPR14134.1 hypothetical protein L323_01340 [Ruminiclostridium papyrosolvens C7]